MLKIKMYKPGGKEIEVNDNFDAVEVMMRDGWRLNASDTAVDAKSDTVTEPDTTTEPDTAVAPRRRRRRSE